ncbi:hypothetical protein NBRC116602_15170 [Hyphomicrobiales bacterium 4NK60-0047b]|jgi:hypothetical protein
MYQQENQDLLDYWNSVRGNRIAPKRVEIIPSAIGHILPVTFILEKRATEKLHFRLAGSKLCEIFGREFRSLDFLDCWPSDERPILSTYLNQLLTDGTIVSVVFQAKSSNDHIGDFEMLFLPMIHGGTTIDRILGSISPIGDIPWLGLTELEFHEISEVHISLLRSSSLKQQASPARSGLFSSNVTALPFLPHKRLVEGKNCSLRVFEGGKTD